MLGFYPDRTTGEGADNVSAARATGSQTKKRVLITGGSGFIGCENDDPSAETLALCLDQAGVEQRQVTPWNAYPWYLPEQAGVTAARRVEGLDALRRVIQLMPAVHTVAA